MATTQPNSFKLAKIKCYDGQQGAKAREFMYRVKLHFLHDAALFTNEKDKSLFCLSYFTADTYAWGKPWLDELVAKAGDRYNAMRAFANFEKSFIAQFSSIDDIRTAEHELETFRQTGTVAAYTAKFRALVTQTEWDANAKKAAYRRGLKEGIRQAIAVAPSPPASYEEFLNWVIGIGDSIDQSHQSNPNFQGSSRRRGGRVAGRPRGRSWCAARRRAG